MGKTEWNPAALAALAQGDVENAVIAATPGGIERQEKEGQTRLTATFDRLPKQYGYRCDGLPRELLGRLGFKIGDDIDDLFVTVTPPDGWTLRPTDHSMHSDIVDEHGRVRGGVFYKAAFYDRKANLSLAQRYNLNTEYEDASEGREWGDGRVRQTVRDTATGETLFASDWTRLDAFEEQDAHHKECRAFLDERFPDWQSVEAYW